MKRYLFILALLLVPWFLYGQTNSVPTTNAPAVQPPTTLEKLGGTNLQDVVIDILRGAKTASAEVYDTSKHAITKAVDFTMEQAPLVVKEFLHWQVAQSIVWLLIWISVASFVFFVAYKLIGGSGGRGDDHFAGWLLRGIGVCILILNFGFNGLHITKVCVAPRVFLIEYVADTLHGKIHR